MDLLRRFVSGLTCGHLALVPAGMLDRVALEYCDYASTAEGLLDDQGGGY